MNLTPTPKKQKQLSRILNLPRKNPKQTETNAPQKNNLKF